MISIRNLTKTYQSSKIEKVVAVDNISIDFENTGLVSVIGKSGCGKTTFLNLLGALDFADSGNIVFLDEKEAECDITKLKERELNAYRNEKIGFVFQNYNLINDWTVRQNLELALQLQEKNADSDVSNDKLVEEVLKYVELEGMSNRRINELSGGQQQRVALARAIIKKPRIVLADEPTGNLDSESSLLIMEILKKMANNALVIVVSHDRDLAERFSDRIIRISDGKVVSDVRNEKKTAELEAFGIEPKAKKLPAGMVLKLAWNALKIKKLKLIFWFLAFFILVCGIKIATLFVNNNYGKSLVDYLNKSGALAFSTYQDKSVADDYEIERLVEIRNSEELRTLLASEFGDENVVPVIKGITIKSVLQNEECKCGLLVGVPESFSRFLKGTLPQNANEVVITKKCAEEIGLSESDIGHTIIANGKEMILSGFIEFKDDKHSDSFQKQIQTMLNDYRASIAIVSVDYCSLFMDDTKLALPLVEFNSSLLWTDFLADKTVFSGSGSVNETDLVLGRLPKAKNEILLSEEYALYDLIALFQGRLPEEGTELRFYDWNNKALNGVFNGCLNLKEYIPNPVIVGIVDSDEAQIWVSDDMFCELRNDYWSKYFADAYEVVLDGKRWSSPGKFEKMLKCDVFIEDPNLTSFYYFREDIGTYSTILKVAIVIFVTLLFLDFVLFFSFNVKDNTGKIGILRALGTSNQDVARIWLTESVLFTAFISVVSLITEFVTMNICNRNNMEKHGTLVNILSFRFSNELIIVAALILLTVISVLIPIWLLSDSKPVELIRRGK